MAPRSVPDRWLDYSSMGRQIEGTRFISFKVPLKMGICSNLPSENRFTIPDMIQSISDQGARLGMVIDLTFTTRYYNKQDITNAGIKYEKIFTAGKEVPSDDVVQEFSSIVHNFETESQDDSLIGVHCTHGVNRTGYLVCRYLIDYKGFTAERAIEAFNKARGHDLERENYLEHLQQRSALIQSGEVLPPKLPLPRKQQEPARRRDQPPSRERRFTPYDHRRRDRDRHRSGRADDFRGALEGRHYESSSYGYYRDNNSGQYGRREYDYNYHSHDYYRDYRYSGNWAEDSYESWDYQQHSNYDAGGYNANGHMSWRHSGYNQHRSRDRSYQQSWGYPS
ncbi:PREDICTED: RNA/RNP complex-1-interacting phosphatase-like isoform X1 [Branchiostoma belcheri]|uniref:RNA/RNP complex-1-interacting phosphatase n=1 Tax=Branchiostoma belcheri TaxID=7741 RepID=A0A6P5AJ43_BRABE|nr:PREDICTED: RNA/RNP complex-1-interacting phosphatase-like isoform X1 [Branchiostoma belcheri]